jgi:hypothetical protein
MSLASVEGKDSLAIAFGINSKAKSCQGSYITLSEWVEKDCTSILKTVKTAKIDGIKLKADTYYKLENGKFVKAD